MKRFLILMAVLGWAVPAMGQATRTRAPASRPAAEAGRPAIPDVNTVLGKLPEGTKHQSLMMPLRDGVKLATEVFTPPGEGPWPVMLLRTSYTRFDAASMGEMTGPPDTFDNEPDDDYDAIEWIAKQPWCNGKVGMSGASGNGISATAALWSLAPHLTATRGNITGDNAYLYWCFSNGARRKFYSWMSSRGQKIPDWPRPTTMTFDLAKRKAFLEERGPKCKAAFNDRAGWFDLFSEGALDEFAAVAAGGKAFVVVAPGAHGPYGGELKFPGAKWPAEAKERTLKQWMTEPDPKDSKSWLLYYLMGDGQDPNRGYGQQQVAGGPHADALVPAQGRQALAGGPEREGRLDRLRVRPEGPGAHGRRQLRPGRQERPAGPAEAGGPQGPPPLRLRAAGGAGRHRRQGVGGAARLQRLPRHDVHGQADRHLPRRL